MDIITLALAKKYTNTSLDKGMDWSKIHGTPSTLEDYGIEDAATKDEVNAITNKLVNVYRYRGTVENQAALNGIDIQYRIAGDVYNLLDTGMNVAWTGSKWDELGGSICDALSSADIEDACRVRIPPTYVEPTATLKIYDENNNLITSDYLIDPGSTNTFRVRFEVQQNDGGTIYNARVYFVSTGTLNRTTVIAATNSLPAETIFTVTGGGEFIYGVDWMEGPIKKDNLGDDYPQGHIMQGGIASSVTRNPEIVEYTKRFYIGFLDTDEDVTSEDLQTATFKDNNTGLEIGPFSPSPGTKQIFVATTLEIESVTVPSAFNVDITDQFEETDYNINGYDIYVYTPGSITSEQTFIIRLEE